MKTNLLIGIAAFIPIVLGIFVLGGGNTTETPSNSASSAKQVSTSISTVIPIRKEKELYVTQKGLTIRIDDGYNRPATEKELASNTLASFELCGDVFYFKTESEPEHLPGLVQAYANMYADHIGCAAQPIRHDPGSILRTDFGSKKIDDTILWYVNGFFPGGYLFDEKSFKIFAYPGDYDFEPFEVGVLIRE